MKGSRTAIVAAWIIIVLGFMFIGTAMAQISALRGESMGISSVAALIVAYPELRDRGTVHEHQVVKGSLTAGNRALCPNPGKKAAAKGDVGYRIIKASELKGKDVQNAQGEKLGSIEDTVLYVDGSVSYAVLSYGGTLGIGSKLFAVPWDEIQFTAKD